MVAEGCLQDTYDGGDEVEVLYSQYGRNTIYVSKKVL